MKEIIQQVKVYANGAEEWFYLGERHRTDGPAIKLACGYEEWKKNGKLIKSKFNIKKFLIDKINYSRYEREILELSNSKYITYDVTIYSNKEKEWRHNEVLHRKSGPAGEYVLSKQWYQNGNLHRTDGPAVEWADGTKYWYQNGKRHRTDGPAVEWADGTKEWYQNGKRHKDDGPAIEWSDESWENPHKKINNDQIK